MIVYKDALKQNEIARIECSRGEVIHVYYGSLSDFDIVVKYKQDGSRLRTPKHIHWVVDLLLKKQGDEEKANRLLKHLLHIWDSCLPFISNEHRENMDVVFQDYDDDLKKLDIYGYYSVEFLVIVAELLMVQEKTNNPKAYMFHKVLKTLLESKDLFKIISTATFRGR